MSVSLRTCLAIVAGLCAILLGAAGCPDATESEGPTDDCQSIGEQCRLGGGQLGVCTAEADGELTCAPQH